MESLSRILLLSTGHGLRALEVAIPLSGLITGIRRHGGSQGTPHSGIYATCSTLKRKKSPNEYLSGMWRNSMAEEHTKRQGPPNNHAVMNELRAFRNWQEREMKALHAKVDRVNRTPLPRHGWLRHVVRDFETNPDTQFAVHKWGVIYWLINFPLVIILFFAAPGLWVRVGVFITLIYSVYANFATDYGAMSAALAAKQQSPLPEIP